MDPPLILYQRIFSPGRSEMNDHAQGLDAELPCDMT